MERDDIFRDESSNRSPLALSPETLLNEQFRVGRVLGVGGFGITYLAFDEVLEMVVAVKEYLPNSIAVRKTGSHTVQPLSSAGEEQDFEFGLKRFLQEARTLAKFEAHPNIVRVRTFFEENGTGYLVMNYYEGRTLAEYLAARNGFLPEEEALLITEQVIEGLAAVHEENMLHRDIDPNNVYLADNGRVVLLDFGAARTAVGERTKSMSVVLKRGYAPHEQYHSYGDQGPWTDVYACSATLYRALTGYKPPEAAARILEDDLAPPNELVPSLSDDTNEAVLEGLQIRPEDRPQSMEAFASLLPDPPGDAEPGWIGEMTTVETGSDTGGAAELQVATTYPCRLYLDGQKMVELAPMETYTLGVEVGSHRLRAVRIDQARSGNATVTASGTDGDVPSGGNSRMSLDALLWQDVVSVSTKEPTVVDIDFEEDGSGGSETTVAADGADVETEAAFKEGGGATVAASDETTEASPATLRVETDRAGHLFVDDERRTALDPEAPQRVELPPGRHHLRVEEADGSAVWAQDVELDPDASRTIAASLGPEKTEADGRMGTGVKVGLGAGVAGLLLLLGWVWMGDRLPGPGPSRVEAWGETVAARGMAVFEGGKSVLDRGWTMAGRGAGTVQRTTNDALGWMGLINKKPKPRPDRIVTTGEALVDVIANDRDPDGQSLRVYAAGPVPDSVAQVTTVDSAHIRFQPASGFAGTAEVPYVVADAPGDTAHAKVTLQVPFDSTRRVVATDIEQPQVVYTDSLGEDGDLDVVIASLGDQPVTWSENNLTGDGGFRAPRALETTLDGVVDLNTADLSGNERTDILAASLRSDAVSWYENEGSEGFRSPQYITSDAEGAISVRTGDFNDDGDVDVVVGALMDETVTWYENQGGGQFDEGTVLADSVRGLETLHVADLDGDGAPGVLVVSYQDSTIARYEPERDSEDDLHFQEEPSIGTFLREPIDLHTADLLGNGREDVLVGKAGDESLVLFENRTRADGRITFGNKRVLTTDLQTIESIDTGDVDGDGDEDIVAASFDSDQVVWFKNRGDGSFGTAQPIAAGIPDVISIDVADVDHDGDLDVLVASQAENRVVWYENHIQ